MIRTIQIKSTATFNDSGVEVPELKKVNFFYGANGSGKTTISNFLYNPDDSKFSSCKLEWLHDLKLKTLVYNK